MFVREFVAIVTASSNLESGSIDSMETGAALTEHPQNEIEQEQPPSPVE